MSIILEHIGVLTCFQLRKDRQRWLKSQGFNAAVVRSFRANEATYEDEFDKTQNVYIVKSVTGRSQGFTHFVMWVDEQMAKTVRIGKGKGGKNRTRACVYFTSLYSNQAYSLRPMCRAPRKRIRLPEPPAPKTTGVPKKVPVDYFEPDFFNESLVVRDRARIAQYGVALPPVAARGTTLKDYTAWNKLSDDEFMETYGNAVMKNYNVPTQEEIDAVAAYDGDDSEESSDESSDDEF